MSPFVVEQIMGVLCVNMDVNMCDEHSYFNLVCLGIITGLHSDGLVYLQNQTELVDLPRIPTTIMRHMYGCDSVRASPTLNLRLTL